MKNRLKLFSTLLVAIFALGLTACDNDDPMNSDLFVGKYNGKVSYTSADKKVENKEGSVLVTKVGDKYNFGFSDKIPSITGVELDKEGNGIGLGSNETGTSIIRISGKKLNLLYFKDGASWSADCER